MTPVRVSFLTMLLDRVTALAAVTTIMVAFRSAKERLQCGVGESRRRTDEAAQRLARRRPLCNVPDCRAAAIDPLVFALFDGIHFVPDSPAMLLITERFTPDLGGVARSAARTAKSLSSLGRDVHVLAWTRTLPPGELRTELLDGVTVHRLGLFANWDLSQQHSLNLLDWLHEQLHFEFVWGHYLNPAGFLAVLFAGLKGLPSTVSARGNDVDRLLFPPGDFARLEWTLARATVITTVSQDLAHKVEVVLGQRSQSTSNIIVLPNVVDAEVFAPTAPSNESSPTNSVSMPTCNTSDIEAANSSELLLGFCGELRHKKGMTFLLQALAAVRRVRPARLLVIGDVRPREQAEISAFALVESEAAEHITVTGHLDDPRAVADLLRTCDVVLQPSIWDGMPNAVLEAMACERIVIASDAGGIPEMIHHGCDGFLIKKSQLHRLGEAILEVANLPESEQQRIGQAARQRVMNEFNAQQEQGRLRIVLERLTSRGAE